jgi:hypothetical protein
VGPKEFKKPIFQCPGLWCELNQMLAGKAREHNKCYVVSGNAKKGNAEHRRKTEKWMIMKQTTVNPQREG